ncbi:hypothetical protein NHX12_011056 [Muraenolepis orangiensis]|uniref:Uncharacterized protein n=1 Tax=Muraenolepis orangiensis TaxID=630683 RepID=A0A9Q0DFH2_9TELE|nr:hypothetical protein NHX12_011056 [Muraenolepis orangiensis]
MNYTTETDEIYDEAFIDKLDDEKEELVVGDIYLGPEGVAAAVELIEKQEQWYAMRPEKAPHITLMVGKTHTAKQLGPMIQKCLGMAESVTTYFRSPDGPYWRICHKCREEGVIEHVERERSIMATTDHPGMKEVYERIDKFDLWAKGDYDVGQTPQHCIKVPLKDTGHSVWQAQYRLNLKREEEVPVQRDIQEIKEVQQAAGAYEKSTWIDKGRPMAGPYQLASKGPMLDLGVAEREEYVQALTRTAQVLSPQVANAAAASIDPESELFALCARNKYN